MAHLTDSAAIFSPSVARIAASTARDWSYIDTWLASKLPSTPSFERNPETLKALLALAAANEQADEDRNLLAQAEASALKELHDADIVGSATSRGDRDKPITQPELRTALLNAIEDDLSPEGQTALDALSSAALTLGNLSSPSPSSLGDSLLTVYSSLSSLTQMHTRVSILHRHLETEIAANQAFLSRLQSDDGGFQPPEDLPRDNLQMQRHVKAAAARLPELQERIAQLAASVDSDHPTIEDIARQEEQYLELLARKKDLDAELAVFHGLPSDPDQARTELEGLRRQLRGVTSRRDQVFEGLVEQASPVRRR
ncbi:hypothetical protein LIA77_11169 [Sarocladium implicatum]|nr:hypothetical protein LIA77_11169 [Sarocladium implicatum]